MKYYIYISETKLEMLFDQIGHFDQYEKEASLGFDIKVLKGNIKESKGVPVNKFSKLNTVIEKLQKANLIGTITQPKQYIKAKLRMNWATYGDDSPITFWGYSSNDLALGLAGSKYHLLGEQREGVAHSLSLTVRIVSWLYNHIGDILPDQQIANNPSNGGTEYKQVYQRLAPKCKNLSEHMIADATYLATTRISGEQSTFEFIAKVLHHSIWLEGFRSSDIKNIILASPIYVSLEE